MVGFDEVVEGLGQPLNPAVELLRNWSENKVSLVLKNMFSNVGSKIIGFVFDLLIGYQIITVTICLSSQLGFFDSEQRIFEDSERLKREWLPTSFLKSILGQPSRSCHREQPSSLWIHFREERRSKFASEQDSVVLHSSLGEWSDVEMIMHQ